MNLVFDFGGVLFRWRPLHLMQQVLPARAIDEAHARRWAALVFQDYGGDWGEFDRGRVTAPELVLRIARRTGLARFEVEAVINAVPGELAPIADSVALLARLRVDSARLGRKMFYLSNMPAPFADHLEQTNDFVRAFDDGIFSSRVQMIKPEPEIFALAAQRFAVPAGQLLFVDDVVANVQAARAAGWQAIHYSDAVQCEQALHDLGWWPDMAPAPSTSTTLRP